MAKLKVEPIVEPTGNGLAAVVTVVIVAVLFCSVRAALGADDPPALKSPAARACQVCGPKCECGPGCRCDARSWLASCKAAPARRATAGVDGPPPIVYYYPSAPRYYYGTPPAYYYPPAPAYRPPLFSAGWQLGPARGDVCIGGA